MTLIASANEHDPERYLVRLSSHGVRFLNFGRSPGSFELKRPAMTVQRKCTNAV